jgi:hypothetical protein
MKVRVDSVWGCEQKTSISAYEEGFFSYDLKL